VAEEVIEDEIGEDFEEEFLSEQAS